MPRALWSGSISFGLVNIPVKMLSATRDRSISFHLLSPDGKCRLRRKLFCPDTGKEYGLGETTRGYEIAPDQYVLVRDEELAGLRPEAGRTVEISDFIDLEQVDPIYYDRTYFLVPDRTGAKAYALLARAMERSGKVALATFVMRQRQHLCAIRSLRGEALLLHTMNYDDEVVKVDEIEGLPGEKAELKDKELAMAQSLIESLSADFDPSRYHDEYREKLEEMLEKKAEGQEVVVASAAKPEEPKVTDLIAALEASLAKARAKKT